MVVPAGVVAAGPADEPDVHVLVAVQGREVPGAPGGRDLITPRFRAGSQVVDERGQLVLIEIPGRQGGKGHCGHSSRW